MILDCICTILAVSILVYKQIKFDLMSWCCGREKPLRKKYITPVYLKKKPISQLKPTQDLFSKPLSVGSAWPIQENSIRKINQGQILSKDNDFGIVREEQDPTNRFILKKMMKCGYDMEEMSLKFKGTKDKWTDPDFVYEDIQVNGHKVEWKRPEQFLKEPALFPEEIVPNDVIQGWLNNCYFLSAVSCLTQKPHRIYSIFTSKQYNHHGYYICKLTFNGIYQEVIVDDLFPVIKENVPVYAKAVLNKYIWVMVLEKCWAKLLKGYTNTNDGYTSEAFYTLTGAPTKFYILQNFYSSQDPTYLDIFERLKSADEKNYAIQVSVGYRSPEEMRTYNDKYGLMTSHAYSLLGVYQTTLTTGQTVKLLQIRNPLSRWQSKLMWNDKDPQWSLVLPSEKKRMLYIFNDHAYDGVFYMDWQTFVGKFNYMFSICQINDQAHYLYTELEVKQGEVKYLLVQTDGSPEELGLSIVQQLQEHFQKDVQYANISIIGSKIEENNQGKRYTFFGSGNYYSQVVENYFFFPKKTFPKGKYLFRIYTTWPNKTKLSTKLVVGLYSSAVIGLTEIKGVNDQEFLEMNCLSVAKNSQYRYPVYSDQESWHCLGMLPETNMGYFVLNFGEKSPVKGYQVRFNESFNDKVFFMFEFEGTRVFTLQCQKGYQYIVLYVLVMDKSAIYRKIYFPEETVRQRMPRPFINQV